MCDHVMYLVREMFAFMRLRYLAAIAFASLTSMSCQIITEQLPSTAGPVDTPTPPPKTPTPKNPKPPPPPEATATATKTPAPTATSTPNPVPTQSPEESCPAKAPAVRLIN